MIRLRLRGAFLLFLALDLFSAGHPLLAAPEAPTAQTTPAFLDASDSITLWQEQPTTPAALQGHITVRCGSETLPVAHIDAADDASEGADHRGAVVLAGTFQSALGGADWQPQDSHTRMAEYAPGAFQFQARLPRGHYEYKIARGGGWAENYGVGFTPGGPNIPLDVPADNTLILFEVDFNRRTIRTSLDTPGLTTFPGSPLPVPLHTFRLTLARKLSPAEIVRPLSVRIDNGTERPAYARDVLSEPDYVYPGDDLGATYTRAATTFKVWSPVSSSVDLLLYPDSTSPTTKTIPLRRGPAGVWSATVPGDRNGTYYQYVFTSYGVRRIAPDIYGRAASADLQRSMVIDLASTNPEGWSAVPAPPLAHPTDAVVYELHLRDFTIDPSGNIPPNLSGTYRGLIAPGTTASGTNRPTGFDYLRSLGVTHVQILPFQSIAPGRHNGYNWGYATYLFDVPEPRYAATPTDPASVIRDVKTMVAGLHHAGLGLIMDVVYNHTVPSQGNASPFWAAVPYYYFRTGPRGELRNESGVGNALADDHPMVRKYVCDSLAYWASQYKVDGFRFDLLGIFTPQTVRAISETLHRQRPNILIYGEPWTGGGPTRFGKGAQRGLGVAVFNDNFRGLVRGDTNGTRPGFALGGAVSPTALQSALSGSPDFTQAPTETINYVSIHDDRTLWDKIQRSLPGTDDQDRRALKLAGAMTLLSQGIPVLEGGVELGRTKGGNPNSYNAGDAVNHFDWIRAQSFADVFDYYRDLIALRRSHPAFRCATAEQVRQTVAFLPQPALPANTIAFTLDGRTMGDSWHHILVIFHGATQPGSLPLPAGSWLSALDSHSDKSPKTGTLNLAPLTAYVLYQN